VQVCVNIGQNSKLHRRKGPEVYAAAQSRS
jgi:hypothetical protein